ncbi:MAG: transcription termination factor NusA [Candidatus Omnitrophota bacterium]
MNGEILSILYNIEREKGIDREVLLQAVESAVLSAVRKKYGPYEEIRVELDRKTGKINVVSPNGEPVDSADFGRIAAQTAKQVIIQKIREAERDVIYNEFLARVGDITNGSVHRVERTGIIVDLGRTEAILPYRELIPKERYKQGDRVRAYIMEVKRAPKGPQIILSRTHSGFIRRLFELEVPEIHQGIVELKAVSREAGDRTKVAVWSNDQRVDCVGACVGMRGSRIKNIVRELKSEKIDIVRWSNSIKEYVTNALSPAKILDIKINEAGKKTDVDVSDDQLSLAIGKKGQNVRLAAKLTGWSIDIHSERKTNVLEKLTIKKEKDSISKIPGVGLKTLKALQEAGITDLNAIVNLTEKDLLKIKGVGKKTAKNIILAVQKG